MPDNQNIVCTAEDEMMTATSYWPPEDVYNPGLTEEDWLCLLVDECTAKPEYIRMLEQMMELGGECTCGQLAEVYGQSRDYYYNLGDQYGRLISKYTDAQPYGDKGMLYYYLIPFVARYITVNGAQNSYWKVREPLQATMKRLKRKTDVPLNTILYGPPGTGKTYRTVLYAVAVVENRPLAGVEGEDYQAVLERYHNYLRDGRISFTTFHQSFGYEEFIEGIRPSEADGDVSYRVQPGVFKRFCEQAKQEQNKTPGNFVFIIDEINRGNISKIFGELITLIEPTKRLGAAEETCVQLPYSNQSFGVPNNVYLLGTMNTADRSIAVMDTALRRRFTFREMLPDPSVLNGVMVEGIDMREMLIRLNQRISVLYDREHTIGHAYFTPLLTSPTMETLAEIFSDRILPLLQEYFYEDYEKIRLVLGDNRKENTPELQFIRRQRSDFYALFGTANVELDEACTYEINRTAFRTPAAYQSI